ncbi:hypothetical protein [Streptomyces sp. CoH27]|uniref:hypothetical protein n=1 Tax=Streptomyces sp. CoH27 TaxID=2875763 RepID=UPI001CD54C30|nr:hypothetical protein [Streptomyces sp. CoH27]
MPHIGSSRREGRSGGTWSVRQAWAQCIRNSTTRKASSGALVATLATDDRAVYDRLDPQIRAFKTWHGGGVLRSRCP